MKLKLVSSIAYGMWAIEEEAAYQYFPVAQAILAGTHKALDDEQLDEDPETSLDDPETTEGEVATVRIIGPITHYGGMCSYGATDYAAMIMAAADDPNNVAAVLDMNTPGGQVDGTEVWAAAIDYYRQSGKPIIGYCESGCVASAGVWGWVHCTERYVGSEICRVGSIGVMAILQDPRKAMELQGIKQLLIRAPQSDDKNKDYTDALDGKTKAYEEQLAFVCNQFLTNVSTQLEGQLTSDEWNTGKMFFAADAQRIGLINGILTRAQVYARARELSQANSQTPNNMFGNKFSALTALAGLAAGTVTAEQVAAVNDQIEKAKIEGVTLALDSELEQYSGHAAQIAQLQSQITAKDAEIAALTGEVASLKTKVATKPAAAPTAPVSATETTPTSPAQAGAVASEETSVDRELASLRALNAAF